MLDEIETNPNLKSEIKRIHALIQDIPLLKKLGELVSVEICLNDYGKATHLLKEEFSRVSKYGYYRDGIIYQNFQHRDLPNYHNIFNKIVELTGDYGIIEGITATIRIYVRDLPVEFVVELNGKTHLPTLVSVSELNLYFYVLNFIQIKWLQTVKKSHLYPPGVEYLQSSLWN